MKKTAVLLFALLFLQTNTLPAQHKKDKMESLRIAYITEKVELTASEAEKFWPVYNEHTEKQRALKRNLKKSFEKKFTTMNETEAEELYYLELQTRQAEADLFKLYSEKIKNIIGVKKTIKLHVAELEFKREVINRIKDEHH